MGILTRGDDQVHLRRLMLEQKGKSLINCLGLNHVVVVKDEDEIIPEGDNFIEQGRQNRFARRWLWRLEHTQHPCADTVKDGLQSRNEVRQKACGVIIPLVQRQPGDFERMKEEG